MHMYLPAAASCVSSSADGNKALAEGNSAMSSRGNDRHYRSPQQRMRNGYHAYNNYVSANVNFNKYNKLKKSRDGRAKKYTNKRSTVCIKNHEIFKYSLNS